MPIPFSIVPDMQVRLKKKHPCGGDTWQVTRTGADIGMLCLTCGRRVFLEIEPDTRFAPNDPAHIAAKRDRLA